MKCRIWCLGCERGGEGVGRTALEAGKRLYPGLGAREVEERAGWSVPRLELT